MRIGVFASHFGSTLQAIIDAHQAGQLHATPSVVISNNSGSEALKRAQRARIPTVHLSSRTHPDPAALDNAMVAALEAERVDLVVLAGYMKKLGGKVLHRYAGRIVNTHPALLPKFGGQGMYGMRVHEAVLKAGEIETGVTVHVVDADYDTGPIVAQTPVPVLPGDDADALAERVQTRERAFLVETLEALATGMLELPAANP